MFFYSSSLILPFLLAGSALAAPNPSNSLERRTFFRGAGNLPNENANGCTNEQWAFIESVLPQVRELARIGSEIKIESPAYRTFMDAEFGPNAPGKDDKEIEKRTHAYVVDKYKKALDQFTNERSAKVGIMCGKRNLVIGKDPKNCDNDWIAFAVDRPTSTNAAFVLCPSFFDLRPNLDTLIKVEGSSSPVDLCDEHNAGFLEDMDVAAGTILHEFMHLRMTAEDNSGIPSTIDPFTYEIRDCVYGPYFGEVLAKESPKANRISIKNADNYNWMAIAAWMNKVCAEKHGEKFAHVKYFQEEASQRKDPAKQPMDAPKPGFTSKRCAFPNAANFGLSSTLFTERQLA